MKQRVIYRQDKREYYMHMKTSQNTYGYITPTKQMVNFNINIIVGKYTSEVAMN